MNQFDKLSYRYVAETILATALFVATSYWARDFLEEQRSLAFHLLVSFLVYLQFLLQKEVFRILVLNQNTFYLSY